MPDHLWILLYFIWTTVIGLEMVKYTIKQKARESHAVFCLRSVIEGGGHGCKLED